MVDNDQDNDEYRFAELDSLDGGSMGDNESGSGGSKPPPQGSPGPKKDIRRNALIAVGLIVFAMVMYKFIGGMMSGKSSSVPAKGSITPAPIAEITPAAIAPQPIQQEQPIQQPVQPVVQESDPGLKQKVASIEATQQSVQSEVNSMNDQVGNVNSNVNNLSAQITKLNQMISDLSSQVSKQSEEINMLMVRSKPKPVRRIVSTRHVGEVINYYINAVIPGRAWLIGTNGSTLTVREGTKIAGYGVVKLIDSMEGRVLTSSGRVIRFSQEDS